MNINIQVSVGVIALNSFPLNYVPFDTKQRLYSQPKKVGLTFDPNVSVPSDISQDSENLPPLHLN